MNKKLSLLSLLLLLSASVLLAQQKKFYGTWVSDETSVSMLISAGADQEIIMTCVDMSDGEELVVTNVHMEGRKKLHADLYTPSTDWRIHCVYEKVGKDELLETISGATTATLNYRRKRL
jgi:hypothetical protein